MGKTSKKVATASRSKDATELEGKMKDLQLDPRGDGMYSGTFRWLETKQFPPLPQPSNNACDAALTNGWEGFLRSRSSEATNCVEIAKNDPSYLDALSFPVTFLYVASTLKLLDDSDTRHHIVVLGATRKAEQRVWLITDYWFEIAHHFPSKQITLWFVGPEADAECPHRKSSQPTNLLAVHHVQGTFTDFVNHPKATDCAPHNTVLIGYNTGFGNFIESGKFDLLFSWLPDLYAITNVGFPAILTCANDYADMNGEFAVQSRILGAKMLLLPQQNPFSMASHLHEDGKKDTAWSRGNSFLYAIQGCDPARRVALNSGDVVSLQNRLDASLDLHLEDALGRHFYKGMVLSKEQASRCKALQRPRSSSSSSSPPPSKVQARPRSSSASVSLKTPTFEIHPGPRPQAVVVLIHVPDVDASHQIAVDVADDSLSLLIPYKYALRASLPFQVENNAPVRAQLTPPFLAISCMRQTN